MRLREVVSGSSAFAWRRRHARATSWLREFLGAPPPSAGHHLPDFARWDTPAFGTRLAEMTGAIFDDAAAGEPAQATHRRVTKSADGQANSGRATRHRRALPAAEAVPVRPTMPASPLGVPAPSTAAASPAVSRSKLATLARGIPAAWPGSGPSRAGHRGASRSVPLLGAAAGMGSVSRAGAAIISGGGATSAPDRATAGTILGQRLNARAGCALVDAGGPAFGAGRLPLGAAAGWDCAIAEPQSGLMLIDTNPQLPAAAAESGPPAAPESAPGRYAPAQPAAPVPGRRAIPQTGPASIYSTPPVTTQRDDVVAPDSTTETEGTADGAPALDPPSTTAHLGALTALERRHGYLPAVAVPLSVAESRAEERHRFDPLEFAEHVRAALIDDARRHGIGV